MKYAYTTQPQVRAAFWDECPPRFQRQGRKTQNEYPADVRMSFIDFVDSLYRDGQISEALARRVTL